MGLRQTHIRLLTGFHPLVIRVCPFKPSFGCSGASSTRLEEQDSNLTEVKVDEMLGLVGHVRSEVAAHNAMPRGVVLLVELLLDECGDVLFNVELLKGLSGNIDSVLLHVFGHISVLDYCLSICHGNVCLVVFRE